MKTQYLLLLVVVCLSSVASKSGGDPIELKFNMPAGMIYTTTIQTLTEVSGIETTEEIEYSMTSLGVDDDMTTVSTMVQAMKVSAPFFNGGYDSRGDNSGQADPYIGNMFTIIMDKQAKVKEINGFEEALGFGTSKTSIGQCMAELPMQPVVPGDSWESEIFVNSHGTDLHFMNKWTLDSIAKGIAYISLKSKYINDNDQARNGAELTSSQSGVFVVDAATGITVNSYFSQETNITVDGQKMGISDVVLLKTR